MDSKLIVIAEIASELDEARERVLQLEDELLAKTAENELLRQRIISLESEISQKQPNGDISEKPEQGEKKTRGGQKGPRFSQAKQAAFSHFKSLFITSPGKNRSFYADSLCALTGIQRPAAYTRLSQFLKEFPNFVTEVIEVKKGRTPVFSPAEIRAAVAEEMSTYVNRPHAWKSMTRVYEDVAVKLGICAATVKRGYEMSGPPLSIFGVKPKELIFWWFDGVTKSDLNRQKMIIMINCSGAERKALLLLCDMAEVILEGAKLSIEDIMERFDYPFRSYYENLPSMRAAHIEQSFKDLQDRILQQSSQETTVV